MPKSKRVSVPPSGSFSAEADGNDREKTTEGTINSSPFVPFLSYITDGATIEDVDPASCIALFLSRKRSDNAVMRLKSILDGKGAKRCADIRLSGMTSGAPTSIIVPLLGDLEYLVDEHLETHTHDRHGKRLLKSDHQIWFGVVDGSQVHCAIVELAYEQPSKWGSFKWRVFRVRHGFELGECRKLAVVQNERNQNIYHFEPTLYEMLLSLRNIYDTIYNEQLKVSRVGTRGISVLHRDVAHRYDGGEHEKNTTVRQAVSVASRLSLRTIEAIGEVANTTCPDIILNNSDFNVYNLADRDSVLAGYDCRLFKKFLCNSTLKSAKAFVNALKDGEEDAQVNTIYRVRHWCELNNYRPVKSCVLNEQYNLSRLALNEEYKFLKYIGAEKWPKNMETTRENLLRTTSYDENLMSNSGNNSDVLDKIWNSYKRQYPGDALALEKRDMQASSPGTEDETSSAPPPPPPPPAPDANTDDASSDEEAKRRAEEEERQKENERRAELRSTADKHLSLSLCGLETHAMSYDDFICDVWTPQSQRADLVLSAIPANKDIDSVKKLPRFCKEVLKTGCYVFLILTESQFSTFHAMFIAEGFKVCDHGFTIHFDNTTIHRRRNSDFPQRTVRLLYSRRQKGGTLMASYRTSSQHSLWKNSSTFRLSHPFTTSMAL